MAERAYVEYLKHGGSGQSLERLAERGGFGLQEFACLFAGHYPGEHPRCIQDADAHHRYVWTLAAEIKRLRIKCGEMPADEAGGK